ncbi:hypothetical protein AAVH_35705 [Aphelenchoides avenae]|nr:hypothetical protein AAVH_35705 [Aphelenchus avenae]
MHPVLIYESLFFCPRNDLERLQPLSQSLLDMIVKGSKVLPLRPVCIVYMAPAIYKDPQDDKIKIFVEYRRTASDGPPEPDYVASVDDGDCAEIFLRLQHTCVEHFCVGIRESAFLRYWRAQETTSFTVVEIEFGGLEIAKSDVFDSIVNHLRPRTTAKVHAEASSWHENGFNASWHKYGCNQEMLEFNHLARDSFLNHLQMCRVDVSWDAAFPPPFFMLEEPGYPNYEFSCCGSQVTGGIDDFIESFVRDGCANKKLKSVCIQWEDDENQQSFALKQLKKPTKIDMPLPNNDLTEWITRRAHQVTQCEMHSLVNAKQWKRMVVYKWTVEYGEGRWTTNNELHVVKIGFGGLEIANSDVFDSNVNHLRPRTTLEVHVEGSSWHENGFDAWWHKNGWNEEMLEFNQLARDSFLNNLQICRLDVSDGIDNFTESFVRDGCANKKLESVCILWEDDENQQSPPLKHLKKPTKIDMPLPNINLTELLNRRDDRVTQCEMHSLVNAKQWKRMVVYKWTIEYDSAYGLHTAHLLQCRLENL